MKNKNLFWVLLCILVMNRAYAQQTLILQPNSTKGKDAFIDELNPNKNFGTHADFISYYWTFSGSQGIGKSLLQFDLSSIPANVQITSAKLSLFHNSGSTSAGQAGENACLLKKITSAWEEGTVTWSTAPTTTQTDAVTLPKSSATNQDYLDIDLTDFVNGWYSDPSTNHGVMLDLVNKTLYSSMKFCSSDVSDSIKRPKLLITYEVMLSNSVILQPDPTKGKDAFIDELNPNKNYGTHADFISYYWTFSGSQGIGKSLLQFDLSSIPANVQITSAKLSLFHNSGSTSAGQAGENACLLKKITSAWEEGTVTWSTAPTTAQTGAITLLKSSATNQDYLDIDLTDFVNGWYSDPSTNHGVMLDLVNKTLYSSMKFCSSDVSEAAKRPKLVIAYNPSSPTSILDEKSSYDEINVFPNPATDIINISIANKFNSDYKVEVYNSYGILLHSLKNNISKPKVEVSLVDYPKGQYILKIYSSTKCYYKKVIKR